MEKLQDELEKALAKPRWNGSPNMGKLFQKVTGDVENKKKILNLQVLESNNIPNI